jgi:two-component system sensor histidine kinase TctE
LLVLVALNTFSVYRNALDAADTAYDRSLLASTRALAERVSVVDGKVVADVPYVALDSFETDTLGRIYYKVTGIAGETVSGYADLPPVPANVPRSEAYPALVRFYHANYNGQPVRIAALLQPVYDDSMRGIALIQVGETLEARRVLSNKILFDTLLWQALLLAAVALLVWFAVRLVLQPLMRLKIAVETRGPNDASDVDPALVHKEVRPLVAALNSSRLRMHMLINSQRRFIADASHQLRTPLTVLKTQAELALRECDKAGSDPDAARDRAQHGRHHRLHRQPRQPPADAGPHRTSRRRQHRAGLAARDRAAGRAGTGHRRGQQQHRPVAGSGARRHGAGPGLAAARTAGQPGRQRAALHAVRRRRHPARKEDANSVTLEVEDTGPGIAAAERERVFAPFYRAAATLEINPAGHGLGLAIVRDIATLHQATITLDDASTGSGLKVRITFDAVK